MGIIKFSINKFYRRRVIRTDLRINRQELSQEDESFLFSLNNQLNSTKNNHGDKNITIIKNLEMRNKEKHNLMSL